MLGECILFICVPSVQHSLSQKYLMVDSMGLKRDFRNEDMISGEESDLKSKDRNIFKQERDIK